MPPIVSFCDMLFVENSSAEFSVTGGTGDTTYDHMHSMSVSP